MTDGARSPRPAPAGAGLWWGSLEGVDLVGLASCAAAAGFAFVSATPAMVLSAVEAHGGRLRAVLDDLGVRTVMIDPLLRGLPGARAPASVGERWRSTFEHGEDDCHRAADAVGATILNVAHFLGAPVGRAPLVDAIGGITARARARGRSVAIEAMPEGGIGDLTEAAAIVAEIGDPSCGLTLDTWHWWRSGGDVGELRALTPGSVVAVQLADAEHTARGAGVDPPSRERLLPGTGAMPTREILELVRGAHPDALIGAEVFDRSQAGRPPAEVALDVAVAVRALAR